MIFLTTITFKLMLKSPLICLHNDLWLLTRRGRLSIDELRLLGRSVMTIISVVVSGHDVPHSLILSILIIMMFILGMYCILLHVYLWLLLLLVKYVLSLMVKQRLLLLIVLITVICLELRRYSTNYSWLLIYFRVKVITHNTYIKT